MKITFVTSNKKKVEETSQILKRYGIEVVAKPFALIEPGEGTVEEIALHKLKQVISKGEDQVMVDDAGIYFRAFPQFPGVLSKRIFQCLGYRGIKKLLAGEDRTAWFEGTIAVCWRGRICSFTGITPGFIIEDWPEDLNPNPSFPYDPIFVPEGESVVWQELSDEKKAFYSYRRKALEKMAEWILQIEHQTGKEGVC